MKVPVLRGIIKRRMLINFRVDASVMERFLPAPFRPKLHQGYAIAGICLIRLEEIRPGGLPALLGVSSENAAHRIAVEWDEPSEGTSEGVFIPVTVPAPTSPVAVQAGATSGQVVLTWKSQAGVQYHVEARDSLENSVWIGISRPIAATGPSSSWSDPITNSVPHRFYRVVSP